MSAVVRCAVNVAGAGDKAIVFLHGYGCDSDMWSRVAPSFETNFKVITYDLVGYGKTNASDYDRDKYASLDGHVDDLIEIIQELGFTNVIAVGHSVSAMTVGLAAQRRPDLIAKVVMICPSPSYTNDGDYIGGFETGDLQGLLDMLDDNYLGWASEMAPQIMGVPDRPQLGSELAESFCQTDPDIAKHFAKVTFLQDHRKDVVKITQPTLLLQCRDDILVPPSVWLWMKQNMVDTSLVVLEATGHCPHVSFPAQTTSAISNFLDLSLAS